MTNPEFIERLANFFQLCIQIVERKNPDYAHQGVPLYDMFHQAFQENIAPEAVLRVLLRKHWSAIAAWASGKALSSETFGDRVKDAANYIAFLAMLSQEEGPALVDGIINHLEQKMHRDADHVAVPIDEDDVRFWTWMCSFRAATFDRRTIYDHRR
jgi:hypothetical protein